MWAGGRMIWGPGRRSVGICREHLQRCEPQRVREAGRTGQLGAHPSSERSVELTSCPWSVWSDAVERSRWIALVLVALYVAVDLLVIAPHFRADGQADQGPFPGQRAGSFLAFVGLACIWWPDILGAVFLMARFGPIPDRWTVVVRILGWGLLVLAIRLRFNLIPPL